MALGTDLSTWRTANQGGSGHNGLLSKIAIGDKLYDIKDPAVEWLAGQIETRLNDLETSTIREEALVKDANAAKFATAVIQGTDGQITVTYGTIRDAVLNDTSETNKVVKGISQTVDGVVTATMGQVAASEVSFTPGSDFSATTVQAAIEEAFADAMALKGSSTDASTAETIAAAKKYADEKVAELAGTDWTTAAATVKNIIDELSQSGNADLGTIVDKLRGMTIPDTSAGAAPGATREATSVAEYVNTKIAEVNAANADGINALDAVVYGAGSNGTSATSDATDAATTFTGDTTNKVVVKVTEVDGKITGVDVKTNDIASANDLTTLDNAVVKSVNGKNPTSGAVTILGSDVAVSSSDATKLDVAISNLNSNKANKAAITSAKVNNWTANYASETLTWTNTETDVYVPVTGQTL